MGTHPKGLLRLIGMWILQEKCGLGPVAKCVDVFGDYENSRSERGMLLTRTKRPPSLVPKLTSKSRFQQFVIAIKSYSDVAFEMMVRFEGRS